MLQGFLDNFQIVISDSQAYKQFENSVAIPVIEVVASNLNIVRKASQKTCLIPEIEEFTKPTDCKSI